MKLIYVDDEPIQIKNFGLTVEGMKRIDGLKTFEKGCDALEWAKLHDVDVAFLDIEMPGMNGIELAKKLKEIDRNIRIVFVTAYEQYALDAFGVNAIGYLLKPYTREDVEEELTKAYYVRNIPKTEIQIKTMPTLKIWIDGCPLLLGQTKCINMEIVDCDLYRMLNGDEAVIDSYRGEYLKGYAWAEIRRKQLNLIKKTK